MNINMLSAEAQAILYAISYNSLFSPCSHTTLRKLYPNFADAEMHLILLIEQGYVIVKNGDYELTALGLRTVRALQSGTQPKRTPGAMSTSTSTQTVLEVQQPDCPDVPSFEMHPLRRRSLAPKSESTVLHFLLAFATQDHALPIPVIDGDVLGRLPEADICLRNDKFLSGNHCQFHIEEDGDRLVLYIEDLGSRNGTYVNGARLEQGIAQPLRHGNRIAVGSLCLLVLQIPD